jgi:hypothetical protein
VDESVENAAISAVFGRCFIALQNELLQHVPRGTTAALNLA